MEFPEKYDLLLLLSKPILARKPQQKMGHDALYGFIMAKIQPADITIKNKNKTHYAKDEQVEAK
jgi:hypothetical protein